MTSAQKPTKAKAWIEAMRLRTLPVSVAGVFAGWIIAYAFQSFRLLPALICLVFAVGAQIASNFANEYFDFVHGLDKKGREGFRRGVTEGDISPRSMLTATLCLIGCISLIGLSLVAYGGVWLIAVGILIAIFALAYSAGPWPLSSHGLGDIAVIIFFGIVPVCLTAYVQLPDWMAATSGLAGNPPLWKVALCVSVGVGLLAANVLIVNNIRDVEDDRSVNKRTTAVIFGRGTMAIVYWIFAMAGIFLIAGPFWVTFPTWMRMLWILPLVAAIRLQSKVSTLNGAALNPMLKYTSLLLAFTIILLSLEIIIQMNQA